MISSVFCLFFRESREQRCQMPLTSMLMGQLDRLWLSTICLAVLNDWQCVFIQTLFSLPCISLPTLLAWKKYLFDLKGLTKSLKRWTRVYSRDIANIGILFSTHYRIQTKHLGRNCSKTHQNFLQRYVHIHTAILFHFLLTLKSGLETVVFF